MRVPGALLAVALGLAACSTGAPPPSQVPVASQSATIEDSEPSSGESMGETPIRIVIGGQVIEGRLSDSAASRALRAQLPLSLEFSDYGGQEVLAELPEALPLNGLPPGDSAPAGTIGYYSPGGALVLYYSDVGYYSGIVRLGHMEGEYSRLTGWSGARTVTLEETVP